MVARTKRLTLREQLERTLDNIAEGSSRVKNPDEHENVGKVLWEVFAWQTMKFYAEKQLKKAWASAQGKDSVIPSDDVLRAIGEGETLVADSSSFSCLVKVSAPAKTFDRDAFIAQVSKRYKIKASELQAIANGCKKEGNRKLEKRIVEA